VVTRLASSFLGASYPVDVRNPDMRRRSIWTGLNMRNSSFKTY